VAKSTPYGVSGERKKMMRSTRALARLGILAVGFGIAGAVASTPGIAAADSSDLLSAVDGSLGGLAAPADSLSSLFPDLNLGSLFPDVNVAISYNGASLFQDGSASASSGTVGSDDFAIAYGANSTATATGSGSYAAVYGDDSSAVAGGTGSSSDSAFVLGDGSSATAGGLNSSSNVALSYGDGSNSFAGGYGDNPGTQNIAAVVGDHGSALAGSNADGAGSFNIAYVEGNDLGTANATGTSDLLDILKHWSDWGTPSNPAGAAAEGTNLLSGSDASGALADGNSFWTDLFSGDSAGALTAGQDFWADLGSSFDPAGAAADSSNFWTELATLF
jgi:hypothetical protein